MQKPTYSIDFFALKFICTTFYEINHAMVPSNSSKLPDTENF